MNRSYDISYLFLPVAEIAKDGYRLDEKIIPLLEKLLKNTEKISESDSTDKQRNIDCLRVIDLIFHIARNIIYRGNMPAISEAEDKSLCSFIVEVQSHIPKYGRSRLPYRVICANETGIIELNYFHPPKYIGKIFPIGRRILISGKVSYYDKKLQMHHPDLIIPEAQIDNRFREYEPIYKIPVGVKNYQISNLILSALSNLPEIPEWLDDNIIKEYGWHSWNDSIRRLHNPQSEDDLLPTSPFLSRLAFDEVLAHQLAIRILRTKNKKAKGMKLVAPNDFISKAKSLLEFELTDAQQSAIDDVYRDVSSGNRMVRLLQGDVGCGKTIVAFFAMLPFLKNDKQVAFMAPTSILAKQLHETLSPMIEQMGFCSGLITSSIATKEKKRALQKVNDGSINVVIGTHALFQEQVKFDRLGLAIIDEQQRFGVAQRYMLASKAKNTHILMMSATPIPRSLSMILYADLEHSIIDMLPKGRQKIETKTLSVSRVNELVSALKNAIKNGEKIYWVCPFIDSEDSEASLEKRFNYLIKHFDKDIIAMVHGKQTHEQRDKNISEFLNGGLKLLIATTVIEVGVNVPDATIMVIEQAENFGLAQLHQLRGRIGRGNKKSVCFLLFGDRLSDNAKQRLTALKESSDGFYLAEQDMKMRGGGDMVGVKQSGFPTYKFVDFSEHIGLVRKAGDYAKYMLKKAFGDNQDNIKNDIHKILKIYDYEFIGKKVKNQSIRNQANESKSEQKQILVK